MSQDPLEHVLKWGDLSSSRSLAMAGKNLRVTFDAEVNEICDRACKPWSKATATLRGVCVRTTENVPGSSRFGLLANCRMITEPLTFLHALASGPQSYAEILKRLSIPGLDQILRDDIEPTEEGLQDSERNLRTIAKGYLTSLLAGQGTEARPELAKSPHNRSPESWCFKSAFIYLWRYKARTMADKMRTREQNVWWYIRVPNQLEQDRDVLRALADAMSSLTAALDDSALDYEGSYVTYLRVNANVMRGFTQKELEQVLKVNGKRLEDLPQGNWTPKMMFAAAENFNGAELFPLFPDQVRGSADMVRKVVRQDGDLLRFAGGSLQDNAEIVKAAVQADAGVALRYASPRLQGDKSIVTLSVTNWGSSLEFASDKLKNDSEVCKAALSSGHGRAALKYVSNPQVVKEAVARNGLLLEFASENMKNNLDVVAAAVWNNGDALQYASSSLRGHRDVVACAVSSDSGHALQYASGQLKTDVEIMASSRCRNGGKVADSDDIGAAIRKVSCKARRAAAKAYASSPSTATNPIRAEPPRSALSSTSPSTATSHIPADSQGRAPAPFAEAEHSPASSPNPAAPTPSSARVVRVGSHALLAGLGVAGLGVVVRHLARAAAMRNQGSPSRRN